MSPLTEFRLAHDGSPTEVNVGGGFPVATTVKLFKRPSTNVAELALIIAGATDCKLTVSVPITIAKS